MKKTKLNRRLYDNQISHIKEYVKYLKSKGYVLVNNKGNHEIWQYNADKLDFDKICNLCDFYEEHIEKKVKNYYHIPVHSIKTSCIIADEFELLNPNDLYGFLIYEKYESQYIPKNKLREELDDLLNLANLMSKNIDETDVNSANNQAKILTSAKVFYTGDDPKIKREYRRQYYQLQKDNFVKIDSKEVKNILTDYFDINPNMINIGDIERNMRGSYRDLLINTNFPATWNENNNSWDIMKKNKSKHNKIKKITEVFV